MTSPFQPRQPGESGQLDESGTALLADAAVRARRYLERLGDRAVAPSPEAVLALGELEFPLPETGLEPARVLAALDDVGSPATVASAGPRYFGFVTGGAWPIAVAASWLLAAWDQNTALSVMSPVATRLDAVAIRWVCQLLGLPAETSGGFVSGASMANATCLAAARDAVLARSGWDAAALGLVGAPPVQVVVGDEVHATVLSWATDAHKWLNTTYDCGIALVRDGETLRAAMRAEASYLPTGVARDPMDFTPQSSQRARGAEVWAVLAALGRTGVSRLVGGHVALARRFASGLAAGGFDILNEVSLNQVVAACDDAAATDRMITALQREGTCWCGPTTWHGRRAMRVSISNWSTTQSDVDRSIAAALAAADGFTRLPV